MTAATLCLLLTALSSALVTGLFYGYSCSVNPGLGRLGDAAYLQAMQSINTAILNPLFFASFMGTLVLMPCSAFMLYRQPGGNGALLFLSASILYAVGVMGVTMMGNVPLNDALAAFDVQAATPQDILRQRMAFEKPWNHFHSIRTVASVLSLVMVLLGCVYHCRAGVE